MLALCWWYELNIFFLQFCCLFSLLMEYICHAKSKKIHNKINLSFSLMFLDIKSQLRKLSPFPDCNRIYPFSSNSCMLSFFSLKYLVLIKFVLLYSLRHRYNFFLHPIWLSSSLFSHTAEWKHLGINIPEKQPTISE